MKVALGVPTLNNFKGLAELFDSLWGCEYTPFVYNNWDENRGVSKAWNDILKATLDYDVTVICNDDLKFIGGGFNGLINGWVNRPEGCVLVTISAGGHEADFIPGRTDMSCFAVNARSFLENVGEFDENFFPAYHEDNDILRRIKLAGYATGGINSAVAVHEGSKTQFSAGKDNPDEWIVPPKVFEGLRDYYVRKWGGLPGSETYTEPFNGKEC